MPSDDGLVGLAGIAYDVQQDRLYVARLPVGDTPGVPDFTSAGTVVILDENAQEVDRFTTGISPAYIILR